MNNEQGMRHLGYLLGSLWNCQEIFYGIFILIAFTIFVIRIYVVVQSPFFIVPFSFARYLIMQDSGFERLRPCSVYCPRSAQCVCIQDNLEELR